MRAEEVPIWRDSPRKNGRKARQLGRAHRRGSVARQSFRGRRGPSSTKSETTNGNNAISRARLMAREIIRCCFAVAPV
jgi:hypothetical protein